MLPIAPRMDLFLRAWRYRLRVERQEIRFVLRNVRRGQTVVDVGAHKGAFTYWLQHAVGPTGQVVAFEPQPEPARYLQAWKEAARRHHVTIVPAAVSERPGRMWLTREGHAASPGARLTTGVPPATQQTFEVPVLSLDDYFAEFFPTRPIHFLKCDAEGHELQVFRGAERILRQHRPLLLFECETRHHESGSITPVFDYLRELGYEGFFFHRDRLPALVAHPNRETWNHVAGEYVNNFAFIPRRAA